MEQKQKYLVALTIAGSDSGGGAGIQADLKTFSSLGLYGTSVITAITAQNTRHVRSVDILSSQIVKTQIDVVMDDFPVAAVKTGMLPTPEIVEVVAQAMDQYAFPALVVDPVMLSTSGSKLVSEDVRSAFRKYLYTRSTLLTPNIPEAARLSGVSINNASDVYRAGDTLLDQGCRAVLIKGGHMIGEESSDILFTPGEPPIVFSTPFIVSGNLHGTGCTLASAIAAYLAQGFGLAQAVGQAKQYITSAIEAGKEINTGAGNGPLNHFFDPKKAIRIDNNIES